MQHGTPVLPTVRGGETAGDEREMRIERWRETATAITLAVAGLLTSWASYQGALWDGRQFTEYGVADGMRVDAANLAQRAATFQAMEVNIIRSWVEAKTHGDNALARFYEERMPADLKPAFQEWLKQRPMENPGAVASPFQLPSYVSGGMAEAARLGRKADAAFRAGTEAKHTADAFHRAGVVLSMAMFLGGISQVFAGRNARIGLTVFAVLALLIGVQQVFTLPSLSLANLMSGGH